MISLCSISIEVKERKDEQKYYILKSRGIRLLISGGIVLFISVVPSITVVMLTKAYFGL